MNQQCAERTGYACSFEVETDLRGFFTPERVAVVGVSDDPSKLGSIVLGNLIRSGFTGEIVAVGRATKVGDHEVFDKLADIPGTIDLVFSAVPAKATAEILADAATQGAKFVILGSSGFAESGNVEEQQRLVSLGRQLGVRIIGPNCNGIYNAHLPLSLGFNTGHGKRVTAGGISIVSHSGALFDPLLLLLDANRAGLDCFVSAGNEADLGMLDYAEFLIERPQTRVLALLADALHDSARFKRLVLRSDTLGKSLIVLKVGMSSAGAKAATAHSSRMAGKGDVYSALFDALGVPQASTLEGFIAGAALLDRYGRQGPGLATVTTSGAGGALVADMASQQGLKFVNFSADTAVTLEKLRTFSSIGNPLDLGIFVGGEDWEKIIPAVADDPSVDVLLAYIHTPGPALGKALFGGLGAARRATGKPVILVAPGGLTRGAQLACTAADLSLFSDSAAAIQAVAALTRGRSLAESNVEGASAPRSTALSGNLGEAASLMVLADLGISTVPLRRCATAQEAIAAAEQFGWPVVVKADVPEEAHKTERNFVRLNLQNADAVQSAVADLAPHTVIVQPMIRGSLEAMIGISRTAEAGLVMMVGSGGVHAEAIGDVAMWPVDSPLALAASRLDATALGRILLSSRWDHPAAREQILVALGALQLFARAQGDELIALDVNPLILGAHGAVAVDALILLEGR